jgi:hypothetical protein
VSSLSPSPHDEATVFVSLNGYRDDEFRTYLYMSTDFGKTWQSVKGNLPESVANVIIQDPVNADLLYCGLDNGTYASLDRGVTWHLFTGMLNVPAYDMLVHPRENELVVGTHGRSVYVADVKSLQALKTTSTSVMAFAPESIRFSERWGQKQYPWAEANEPKMSILYYVGKPVDQVKVEVYDEKKALVRQLTTRSNTGFNTFSWDVKIQDGVVASAKVKGKSKTPATEPALRYAGKGKYTLKFVNGTDVSEIPIEIK